MGSDGLLIMALRRRNYLHPVPGRNVREKDNESTMKEANRKALKEVLQTISNLSGIEISEDYVAYSYYANLLESGKDVTAADIPEKYYYIYDRIGISFIQAAGVSGNKLGDLGLLSKSILEDGFGELRWSWRIW